MKYVIDLDLSRCIACGACTVACMDQNDIEPQLGDHPLRSSAVVETGRGDDARMTYMSFACMHCSDAPCVRACPVGCIKRDEATGFVAYDNARCIGCHSCSMACPFSAPSFDHTGKMRKCDGCYVRVADGRLPACVKVCPMNALALYTEEEYEKRRGEKTAASLAAAADAVRQKN